MRGRPQRSSHQRNAILLDAEVAGRPSPSAEILARGAKVDLVLAELGFPGNRPFGLGGPVGIPPHGQLVSLVAAGVLHNHALGKLRGRDETKAARDPPAQEVLHVDGLASAQQRAIEDGVSRDKAALPLRREIESPALDAFIPVRLDEGHIALELRAHEQHLLPLAPGTLREISVGGKVADARRALRIGRALPQELARAITHLDVRARNRLRRIERGDPNQRGFDPPLDVHAEVGHQHRRRHVHWFGLAEQRRAQNLALDLDDVETRSGQGNANNLERLRACKLGNGEGFDAGRFHAAKNRPFPVVPRALLDSFNPLVDLRRTLRWHPENAPLHPLCNFFGAAEIARLRDRCFAFGDLEHAGGGLRLDISQGDRENRARLPFEDSEIGRELRERRILVGVNREREFAGIGKRPAVVILQPGRNFDLELRLFGERTFECDLTDDGFAFLATRRLGLPGLSVGASENRFAGVRPGNGGGKNHAHRRYRHALRLRILALAHEGRRERGSCHEGEDLVVGRRHSAHTRHSPSPDQAYFPVVRETLPRLNEDQGLIPLLSIRVLAF